MSLLVPTMVVIAARAPALLRKLQYAFSGGGTKRKRDEPPLAAPQPPSDMSPPLRVGINRFSKRPRTQGCLDDEVRPFSPPSLLSPPLSYTCLPPGQWQEIALHRQQQSLPGIRRWHPRKSLSAVPKIPPSSSPPFSPPNSSSGKPWPATPAARPSPVHATTPTRCSGGGPAASPSLRPPQPLGSASARVATAAAGPSVLAAAPPPVPPDDDVRHSDPGSFEEQVERMRRLTDKIALQEKGLHALKGREKVVRDAQARTVADRMAQSAARRQRIEAALKVRPAAMGGRGGCGEGRVHGRPHLPPAARMHLCPRPTPKPTRPPAHPPPRASAGPARSAGRGAGGGRGVRRC